MHLWQDFLSSWNGISFFYDDFITKPEDIQLFTDAVHSSQFTGALSFIYASRTKFRNLAPESDLHPIPVPPFSATTFN
ncbi:Protein THYLAKOID ASSEMBLY 8-like chloroplastic [Dissostichus eleginoides]|uniref:Protein THYLAKOID ASSEMBLY 8-like chloroplastic n=1 Tax=Dissostichus eleginoides TaxID=100907 RepID=A0AAD9EXL8_DISEL|nr:Protein THYLAKOID ASSEMBLY 8-like chloroplastic [Dissostichus eleginoides]